MNATIAERLINREQITDKQTGIDGCIYDQIVEVESADDSAAFIIIDGLMLLMVYLAPVAVFGCLVAPVVARLRACPSLTDRHRLPSCAAGNSSRLQLVPAAFLL